jgi:hypothetical protein
VEIAIIVTETISQEKRDTLIAMGARLIIVQSIFFQGISDKNEQWKNCYTKLYMFKMDFYKQILYLDTDFTITKPINGLFDIMDMEKLRNPPVYFFGAAQDWGLPKGTFNAGMMLFEPSPMRYFEILDHVKETSNYDSHMMEQGLLNWYFKQDNSGPGKIGWFELPTEYNCQWVNNRPIQEVRFAHILHFKPWQEQIPAEVYTIWKQHLQSVMDFQRKHFHHSDLDYIPETQRKFQSSLKKGTFGTKPEGQAPSPLKIAIYTLLVGEHIEKEYEVDRIIANRERYVKKWNDVHFIQRKLDNVRFPVWQKVYDAEKLIKEYDWIWLLDADAYIMNADISLHDLLGNYEEESDHESHLIIANDCNGFNAGSFFIHKSAWTEEFIKKWKELEYNDHFPNADIWKEQAALVHLYQTNVNNAQNHVLVVPQQDINAYAGDYCGYGYQPGDFVVHSPGMGYNGVKSFLRDNKYKEV